MADNEVKTVKTGDKKTKTSTSKVKAKASKKGIKAKSLSQKKKTVTQKKKEAVAWYKKLVGTGKPTASNIEIYREDVLEKKKAKMSPGVLLHFTYFAKWRDDLPYWDAFPLALIMDVQKNGFLSLNLHYLPYYIREKFLTVMMKNLMAPDKTNFQKVKFTYGMLAEAKKFQYMRPAIKKHLFSQIKSKPVMIPPQDFDKIIFLPSSDFVKASESKVWRDSAKMTKGYKTKK